jgi:hypothetical protein
VDRTYARRWADAGFGAGQGKRRHIRFAAPSLSPRDKGGESTRSEIDELAGLNLLAVLEGLDVVVGCQMAVVEVVGRADAWVVVPCEGGPRHAVPLSCGFR